MATRPASSQARQFAQLIARLEPEIRRAFLAAVVDLHEGVNWPELIRALEQYDTPAAIAALNINPAAFHQYAVAATSAYTEAGAATVALIKQNGIGGVGLRFQAANPRAEQWVAENVGGFITRVTEEQIDVVRLAIERGYAAGEGPRTIAVDLVGRVGPGGTRQGGVLGLDAPRAERLQRVSQGMRTPEGVRDLVVEHADGTVSLKYKVNKATGNRILRAHRAGTAVPEAERIISERQYENALLKARADTVAATETASAVMNAQAEAWEQAAEQEGFDTADITKTWRHRRGPAHGRDTHISMAGTTVRGLETPFELPDGSLMQHPHDPEGGARNNINCACGVEYSRIRRVA